MPDTRHDMDLRRQLRVQLHRHGRRAVQSTFLQGAWKTSKIEARARTLTHLAWHTRNRRLTWPAGDARRYAMTLQQAARGCDGGGVDVVPIDHLLATDWPVQMEAALALLAAIPARDRRTALPVDCAEPGDTP
ncbi:hypothetical protein [Streptomyces sp. 3N207]|uniref:hypothetical protein n=1 Tax=Streptomyces sp. 3N207 TaxID=3457417 RepID=UPI003FD574E9